MSARLSGPLVRLALAVFVGAAGAFLLTGLVRGESPGQTWTRFSAWAGGGSAAQPLVSASVLVGGSEHPAADGRIGLPSGTRFQLRVHAARAGVVRLMAVNPKGEVGTEPLWTADIAAGAYLVSPVLRLEGTTGQETLRVLLLAPGSTAEIAQQQVQIWHQ